MEKSQTSHREHEETDNKVRPAAANTDLNPDVQSQPKSSGTQVRKITDEFKKNDRIRGFSTKTTSVVTKAADQAAGSTAAENLERDDELAEYLSSVRDRKQRHSPGSVTTNGKTQQITVGQEVMSGCCDCRQQIDEAEQLDASSDEQQQPVLIHGLSVERYRDVHSSVLQPSVLAALSSSQQADYVSQVLELKQRLWTELSRPRLQETLREDGRVEVKETFDLT